MEKKREGRHIAVPSLMRFGRDIGIDLGTANTLVCRKGEVILNEPSVVAIRKDTKEILAVGNEAKAMIGRTPGDIIAIQPLQDGVIADYEVTEKMLNYFIRKCVKASLFNPRLVVGIPRGATSVERRAVEEAAFKAGAREVYLIEEPMAAAIGAGIPIEEPTGHMVVDIGGGTTEIAVTSLGGIVAARSIRIAGNAMDKAIIMYLRRTYSIVIGERSAEDIKVKIGCAFPEKEEEIEVRGRNLVTGLPVNLIVHTREINEAIAEPLSEIIRAVRSTLEETKPEVASDIYENGVILTGGGALIKNIDKLLKHETNLPVFIAEEPLFSVAKGTALVLEHQEILKSLKSRKLKSR